MSNAVSGSSRTSSFSILSPVPSITPMAKTTRVAAVQAEPVWNDLQGGVAKTITIIDEAAKSGANVIGFPEVWIPGYPWSIWAKGPIENAAYMNEYFANSLVKESDEMNRIRAAVKESGMFCVLGYSERYRGTLYLAQSYIDPNGEIVHHRRKIKPTHVERGYWGDGQGESLKTVVPTPFGRIGALNCWEHTQTLLRYYEYSQDVEIHVASWPLIWNKPEGMNWPGHITGDMSSRLSQIMAFEGACFVMICSQIMTEKNKEKTQLKDFEFAQCPGGGFSMIFSPFGEPMVKALSAGEEGILYADVDLNQKRLAQQQLDVVGHYCRPDQLSLRVNRYEAKPVCFAEDEV